MKAINKKKRATIQSIALARRKNSLGGAKTVGIRVLKKAQSKSPIEALKADDDGEATRSITPNEESKTKPKKNKLLSQLKKRNRSCSSCWG